MPTIRAGSAKPLKGNSPWDTLRQSIANLGTVVRHMQPTWHAATIDALTPAFLEQQQVRGVIWDVDGTLTPHHGAQVVPALAPAFRRLVEASNVRHVIVSNAPDARFTQLAQLFPDIPILRLYALHGEVIPHRLHGSRNSLSREEFEALQAAGAVVVRKPNARLTQYALQELECSASEALMIGDQFMTDVAGARMADVRALKVETAAPGSFPFVVRTAQHIEQVLYTVVYGTRRSLAGRVS